MGGPHRIGDVSIMRVSETYGSGFAPSLLFPDWQPDVLVKHRGLLIPDCFSEAAGVFISSIHTWVLRTRHHTILIDSCVGNHKNRTVERFHQLNTPFLARLKEAGVAPETVDYVLCTHLHVDHCGWNTQLVDGRWVPTFPNAKYVFSKAEHDHWSGPAGKEGVNAGVFEDSVLPVIASGQAEIIDGAGSIGDELSLHPTPGHSPGHVAIELKSQQEEGLFSGDIMHQPVQVYHPEWNSRFCYDQEEARASRRFLLERAAERGTKIFTAHFARSSCGHVSRQGDQFDWRFAADGP
jgi:glyoxylase-like metal-dependent hydrolase (beta-lactamase superfamily II)